MFKPQDGLGSLARNVPGPPWIFGQRGAPLEAPENTIAALRRALELGLDGVAYDLRASASGDLVLLADAALERTTDGHGRLATKTLPELYGLDAGGWFHQRFHGEPLALFDEALGLEGNQAGSFPQHLVVLREPGLVGELARMLKGRARHLSLRVASYSRETCINARDSDLSAMLLVQRVSMDDVAFVRDARLAALGAAAGGWADVPEGTELACERWGIALDDPEHLLEACRLPLNAFSTHEPRRALAARALVFLAPGHTGAWPITVGELPVGSPPALAGRGEWCGAWSLVADVVNPLAFRVRVAVRLVVRRGAFEAHGLPVAVDLEPRQSARVPFELSGGSWSPGGDGLVVCDFFWQRGPGRPAEHISFDAPLVRVRTARLGADALRLAMLREAPRESDASVTIKRKGKHLLAAVENSGGLSDPRLVVHLDGATFDGARGLRLPLPARALRPKSGECRVPFSIGFVGRAAGGARRTRRWAGGVPAELEAGSPGWLVLAAKA